MMSSIHPAWLSHCQNWKRALSNWVFCIMKSRKHPVLTPSILRINMYLRIKHIYIYDYIYTPTMCNHRNIYMYKSVYMII